MRSNRYDSIYNFATRSAELMDHVSYHSNHQVNSDILGDNVDVLVHDSAIDVMHYDIRDNIQLVDWQYLKDHPDCTWDEWRSNDITHLELNNIVKGYFQEILDESVVNNGFPQWETGLGGYTFTGNYSFAEGAKIA